jgi:hypothetical protein
MKSELEEGLELVAGEVNGHEFYALGGSDVRWVICSVVATYKESVELLCTFAS